MIADLLFLLFAGILLLAGMGVIMAKNPMYCVLFLILAFFNAAGLFLLLGAEFLALLLIMVYVGAVAVMFLFVIMTIDIDFAVLKDGFATYLPVGALVAGLLLVEALMAAWGGAFGGSKLASLPMQPGVENIRQLGDVLFTVYAYPFLLAGMILLVAMVGAIVLTHRRRPDVQRQNIAKQINRTREESFENVKIKPGAKAKGNIFVGKGVKT